MSDQNIERAEQVTIEDDGSVVSLTKIYTPNGQRLEMDAPAIDQQIRIDAVELEAIAWQDREVFLAFLEDGDKHGMENIESRIKSVRKTLHETDTDVKDATDPIEITNEYAEGHVRKIITDVGERCEITAPKLGYGIRLTPTELESITWQTMETFNKFLENPYGPISVWTPDSRFRLDM